MNNTRPKVSVYWDCQNVPINNPDLAKDLLCFANQLGELSSRPKAYSYWRKVKPLYQQRLYELGFQCIDVPVIENNAVDTRLIDDCQQEIKDSISPDIVILVTGDGDFTPLVEKLQNHNKIVKIFAQSKNTSRSLISKVGRNNFYDVHNLPELVDITESVCSISYEDAIACLIEAIHTALSKGKRTVFNSIDSLMRNNEHFPNYKGVACIQTRHGGKFSKFSKFIAAVANDGKVYLEQKDKRQEVFIRQ